jgi:TatD DNase family protein
MEIKYFDAHCHVQFEQYDADREVLIARMQERGVSGLVVGCDYESSKKAIKVAEAHDNLYASIGLHPNHESDEWFEAGKYRELAQSAKVVAIGECGLDYFRPSEVNEEVKKKQKALLNDHVELAAELALPLIIHSRPSKGTQDAYQDLIAILTEAKQKHSHLRGDIHFFVGGIEEMRAITALGFTVSFTAVITFARDYDAVIKAAPLDMILSETDAPYVPPTNRPRGSRNDPLAVEDVALKIAEIRGEDPELVRAALLANAQRLFNLA